MSTPSGKVIRVLVVDDHEIIRDGLRNLIGSRPGMAVVGDAGRRDDALRLAAETQPDVIVLDLDLGEDSGLTLLPELLDKAPGADVIILTGMRDPARRDEAMELGAKGVVSKERGTQELLAAIEKVHNTGEYWFEPGAALRLVRRRQSRATEGDDPEAERIARLTPTERELIACLGRSMDNRQIAESMNMAEATVRNNFTRIYDKLEVKGGRLGLLVYAYKHGLIKP